MEKRRCGKSGIDISSLGIGCWSFGGGDYWGPQDQRDVNAVIQTALDCGINYFDTAEVYNDGHSEESLGKALMGRRHEAVIGTKVSPENTKLSVLRKHCEASLRRLQTDYIDIYMVHWPIPNHKQVEDAFATLMELQSEGKSVPLESVTTACSSYPKPWLREPESMVTNCVITSCHERLR